MLISNQQNAKPLKMAQVKSQERNHNTFNLSFTGQSQSRNFQSIQLSLLINHPFPPSPGTKAIPKVIRL